MTLPALYEIANEYREALEKLADMDLPQEVIADTLEAVTGNLEVKATNVAMFARNLESLAESIKEAEAQMAHRRKVIENRADSIRSYIKTCMESAGVSKIDCPYFSLAIRKNPPAVIIEGNVPKEYMRFPEPPPPTPDKTAIAKALKEGKTIEGAYLSQGTRLDIK